MQLKKRTREAQITGWYEEVFPAACAYIRKRGGQLEDAKELFQEAVVLYYEKHTRSGFLPEKAEAAYLIGIVKKLWLKNSASTEEAVSIEHIEIIDDDRPNLQHTERLLQFLEKAGRKCMDILQSFYYEQLSMRELSVRYGYGSERSATVQKYKCLEKVRDEVKQRSLSYEDFLD
ncbi:MAG: hypothetical protein RIF33_13545 [Cyclobacteriaceae bacterium]